jgi:hypothetical protein
MFERIGEAAEKVATGVSRRQFLGQWGKSALALAVAIGGLVAVPGVAQAGRRSAQCCVGGNTKCPNPSPDCKLVNNCLGVYGVHYCQWDCNGKLVTTGCA